MLSLLITVVIVALIFDYINGFHDAANAISASVATGVMPLRTAVFVSGCFNFIGALAGTAVAKTLAEGFADATLVTPELILAALIGASIWNLLTWWYGIPSSSSHALIGGLCGAVVTTLGWNAFNWNTLVHKVLIPLVVSPLVGFAVALILMIVLWWIARSFRPSQVNRSSRCMQFVSACTLSFAHGTNDAQKVMGIITLAIVGWMAAHKVEPRLTVPMTPQNPVVIERLAEKSGLTSASIAAMKPNDIEAVLWEQHRCQILVAQDCDHKAGICSPCDMPKNVLPTATVIVDSKTGKAKSSVNVPFWVMISCGLAIALGTMAGGKRIIKTMSTKIIKITPLQGVASDVSGTATILTASHLGIPLSTTHVTNACVMGSGSAKRLSAVRWTIAGKIVTAWVLTLPASAAMAAIAVYLLKLIF